MTPDHMSEGAAMRRAEMLGYDEELRLTLAADGTYGVIAYRDSHSGRTFAAGVDARDGGGFACGSPWQCEADDAEGLIRAFARTQHKFGRLVVVRRGTDEPVLEIEV